MKKRVSYSGGTIRVSIQSKKQAGTLDSGSIRRNLGKYVHNVLGNITAGSSGLRIFESLVLF